jgi:hypothetical protein
MMATGHSIMSIVSDPSGVTCSVSSQNGSRLGAGVFGPLGKLDRVSGPACLVPSANCIASRGWRVGLSEDSVSRLVTNVISPRVVPV